ncbi:arylsulfatase [Cryphonectria parasitica EP155]|uniref:Arylsulfatase n=1 Tax=Cryphonectria parasitica (strain ATCC 38755 / EP155) TaxID=660469 RepID=A0A9P5CTD5_CRYP1|nr:arylsulfatase [Cryphonectria parasitica EP155]KAF3769547.1 arylsulfatase [Cryphonectria parasitica EP155]
MQQETSSEAKRPNFLLIVADDLGFSDCSCYGSEIQTPNIDSLATAEASSLRFTEFHVAAACSPTRSMLMTGTDHHIAGLGQLQEFTRSSPAHRGQKGHEGYLNEGVVALPQILQKEGGYLTLMSGKWHLGVQQEHHPVRRGFDKSFALLPGCANHYNYEPAYQDPFNEPGRFFETATRALHAEDDHYVEDLPKGWYSSDGYTDKMLSYLSSRTEQELQKPFFAYLPFSAPHWPLQAPPENMAKYRGLYDDGPEALRQRRVQKLKELGLVHPDAKPHPVVAGPGDVDEWEHLDDEVRAKSARAMEAYSGMVDRMDWNIGRVLDYLKASGEYDNTLILFMSDNGAEGASYEASPIVGPRILEHIDKYYDNSLENIGRGDSFVWYGCRWAQAATAPSRLYKMFSTEGGCRVPLVVKPPKTGLAGEGRGEDRRGGGGGGIITDAFCTVMDLVPTVLDLAGLLDKHPGGTMQNGHTIAPLRGRSWKSYLHQIAASGGQAPRLEIHDKDYVVGFEIAGSGALRRGDWKITFVPAPRGPQRWELFNIRDDPGETSDLAEARRDVFVDLLRCWEEYKAEVGVVGLAGEYPAAVQGDASTYAKDEFEDPYAWIKYIGRPERTPAHLLGRIPLTGQGREM